LKGFCPCCTVPAMAAGVECCALCGEQGAGFKRCSRCKQAWYCGAECQNADWKRHKKRCAPPVPLKGIFEDVQTAHATGDWRGVLKWEGRMEELMALRPDDLCLRILMAFSDAHQKGWSATGSKDHARSHLGLAERQIPLFGKLQRFRDQGTAMCSAADTLRILQRDSEAAAWFQRARDVGAAHGLFSLECKACMGLGHAAMKEGRHEEGVALLRNGLVAAELNELDDPFYELIALHPLMYALLKTHSIDEVEPLVLRYREAAKAKSEKEGLCFSEFDSLLWSARLHEVLHSAFENPLPQLSHCFRHGRIASDCHRFHRARDNHERRHKHPLNLALSAGTREASRGREGGARSARPDARERGNSAGVSRSVCSSAGVCEPAPHCSRFGGW